jgi:hypothetical protein
MRGLVNPWLAWSRHSNRIGCARSLQTRADDRGPQHNSREPYANGRVPGVAWLGSSRIERITISRRVYFRIVTLDAHVATRKCRRTPNPVRAGHPRGLLPRSGTQPEELVPIGSDLLWPAAVVGHQLASSVRPIGIVLNERLRRTMAARSGSTPKLGVEVCADRHVRFERRRQVGSGELGPGRLDAITPACAR